MYQLVPTYPFSKKISKNAQPVTGYQLQFTPFDENGVTKQIVVLDIDTPNAHIIANYIMAYLGLSRTVKSVKGMHIYYKMPISDIKKLKSVYFLKLLNLLEQGIIDEAYAKQFIETNKHAQNVYRKHKKMLFPIEVKTKRIMAPGSIVFSKAEKLYRKLLNEGKIDLEQFDPEEFVKSNFGVSCSMYTYKADSDKPIHEGLADLSADRLLAFFGLHQKLYSSNSSETNFKPDKVHDKVNYQTKTQKGSQPFVYSCPKFGNHSNDETLHTADYVAEMIRQMIAEPVFVDELNYTKLVRNSVEKRIGVITLGRAILCPLHKEKNPSVAFYETQTGIRMFEFHKNRTNNNCKSLEELLFALNQRREVRMSNGDGNYTYILRYALADNKVNSAEQIKKTNMLYELLAKLNTVADFSGVMKSKLSRLEKINKLLLALAANFATTFSDDIFSARFGEKVIEFSKSTVNLLMHILIQAGAIAVVSKKHVGSRRKALVYTVPFDIQRAYAIAVRILLILGILQLAGKQLYIKRSKKLIAKLSHLNHESSFCQRSVQLNTC